MFEEAGDAEGAAFAWAIIGGGHWGRCEAAEAGAAWRRAVDLFDRAGNRWLASEYVGWLSSVWVWGPATCEDAMVALERLAEEAKGRPGAEFDVGTSIGTVLLMLGDLDGARRRFEASDRRMQELSLHLTLAHSSQQMGLLELLSGHPAAAEAVLRSGAEVLERIGSSTLSIVAAFHAQALYALGRLEEADEAARKALAYDDVASKVIALGVRAAIEARRARFDAAEQLAHEGISIIDATDFTVDRADARVALAEVLELAGRRSESADVTREALALYEEKGNVLQAGHAHERLDRLTD